MAVANNRYQDPDQDEPFGDITDGTTVMVDTDTGAVTTIDAQSGASKTEDDEGGVTVDLDPPRTIADGISADDFDANLAETLDETTLSGICSDLLEAIEADEHSRREWLETRAAGIKMLGFRIEEPKGDVGSSAGAVEGMSTVRHPLLTEAVIRFQSNAGAELLPAEGPVKVRNDAPSPPEGEPDVTPVPDMMGHNGGPPLDDEDPETEAALELAGLVDPDMESDSDNDHPGEPDAPELPDPLLKGQDFDDLAECLEKDLNHYLTVIDKGYRSDTDRMLFWVGFGGCGFKKIYNDPIRRMPISRSVDASNLIVSDAANDIDDAGRVTHKIMMRKATLIRMQIAGAYRKVPGITDPQEMPNPVDDAIAEAQGVASRPQRPQDNEFTIYECYVELDIKGFEHLDEDGKMTGLPLPYRVTMEKDSRQVLEIRRNWREDDENCLAKKVFVKYPFMPALGFYDIGLLQILGNTTRALTGAWRVMLDSGMFSNFPGFLYGDQAGRQITNEFRVPPGGGVRIQTGGKPIQDVVMPLPYKDVGQGLALLAKMIESDGQRVGGTAELQVGEGRQDAPVGTTLAMIEQATKMLAAVHIRLHAAQAEEFQLLKERFREDPEALWRNNRRPSRQWERDEFLAALDNCDIVPAADPNTPSHMHRIMKAVAIMQLALANPNLYDIRAVHARVLKMVGVDANGLLLPPAPPQAPPPDPKMVELQLKAQEQQADQQAKQAEQAGDLQAAQATAQARIQEVGTESADRAADRASRERVADTRDHTQKIKTVAELARDGIVPPETVQQVINAPPDSGAPPTPTPVAGLQPGMPHGLTNDPHGAPMPAPGLAGPPVPQPRII